jgi:hypothetical protein
LVVPFNNAHIPSCNIELISVWSYGSFFCTTEMYE